ncbi:MurR/RpiR family transcriptional regulator [Radiobacillus sp. PE A8.2]|uniref:MurR/RpiR family transcriptional regulator n=1 Tax=Radiobacillus sp. PE A8.2 TaxID=3380349 RepID=UPI003890C0BC
MIILFTNEQISTFTELEIDLYKYIVNHADKVIFMRIRDLANETHVSTTTVLRFCRKCGFDGFAEFKVQLKMHLGKKESSNLIQTQTSFKEFIERTLTQEHQEKMSLIASVLAQTNNIVFIGIGTSGILAEYGARYFSGLKRFSLHIKDPFFPIHASYLEESVVVVLSVSGESNSTISLTNKVKEKGATVVSITNHPDSTIAKLSDYNLSYYVSQEFVGNVNLTTQIPVVHLLESLAKETYRQMEN